MLADIGRYWQIQGERTRYNQGMTQIAVGTQIWNYVEVGSGKSAPILILHGWGRSGNEWVGIAKDLSAWSGRKAYVVDLPGFCGSSLPTVLSMAEYSMLVAKFCEYMEIKKAVILGHSLGGRVGILLAALQPNLVEKLILVDPAGVKPRSIKRVVLKNIAKLFGWVPRMWRQKVVGRVMDSDYHNSPALRGLYRIVVGEDLQKYLHIITCPTLVVWGENDPILPLSLTHVYRKKIRDVRIRVVWGAGHDPHLSHPDQTLAILQEASE